MVKEEAHCASVLCAIQASDSLGSVTTVDQKLNLEWQKKLCQASQRTDIRASSEEAK